MNHQVFGRCVAVVFALSGMVSAGWCQGLETDLGLSPVDGLERGAELQAVRGEGFLRLRFSGGLPHSAVMLGLDQSSQIVITDMEGSVSRTFYGGVAGQDFANANGPFAVGVNGFGQKVTLQAEVFELGAASAQRGDVIVTEFMKDPAAVSDSRGEWIELTNVSTKPRQIAGWQLQDAGSNSHVIAPNGPPIILLPGDRFVLGNNDDLSVNGGVQLDYKYSSFSLGNGDDEIFLVARNGQLVDSVVYDDGVLWPDLTGESISLSPNAYNSSDNDDPVNWCHSLLPLSLNNSDTGTPGLVNELCP